MDTRTGIYTAFLAVLSVLVSNATDVGPQATPGAVRPSLAGAASAGPDDGSLASRVESRRLEDLAAIETFRPGYQFWQNVFTIPDGSIAFGSAVDGRRLVVFPTHGDWGRDASWDDVSMASLLGDIELPKALDERRDYVAELLASQTGPVLHNPTRGRFLATGTERYGRFLDEWAAIYERFGVPSEIGLAQALVESGFEGTRRSEAGAVGLCQWLSRNWKHLDRLDPAVIEIGNQTTQAAYCAAYLSVLATKYGSFIPALSEHHAGGTNVGRTLVNGERLGGIEVRERYFLGAALARDLRTLEDARFKDIYGTYGPRSYFYAEMVFGNAAHVRHLRSSTRQSTIHAMRTTRALPIVEITRRTGLSVDEVRRYNPALVKRVPANSTLYLPKQVAAFGSDVAFWHKPASPSFTAALNSFVRFGATPEEWEQPTIDAALLQFEQQFRQTKTQEGTVMATVLAYVRDEGATSGRREILSEFRTSPYIRDLFDQAIRERPPATN